MSPIPWKESNLALIGTDLDHKIKAAAAEGEPQWQGLGESAGLHVWRIEQFRVVPSTTAPGEFYTGDSYVVLNSFTVEGEDVLKHDLHIWIGKESSQDEYGTAAYKMVEADESLGGGAIQHREVEGSESDIFRSYFSSLAYLAGGAASGFTHVEASVDVPHLYRVKGTEKGLSLTQMPLAKTSLNKGDSFILFANNENVWVWHGESSNYDEKTRVISTAEAMCSQGSVTILEQGEDSEQFWAYLPGDGDIAEADELDETIEQYSPTLFLLMPGETPEEVAKGEPVKVRFGRPEPRLSRSLLDEANVYLIDAGWELFVWIGASSERSEKLSAMALADAYCKADPRTANLPLTMVKSGWESSDFNTYFE
jgi:gelsolin